MLPHRQTEFRLIGDKFCYEVTVLHRKFVFLFLPIQDKGTYQKNKTKKKPNLLFTSSHLLQKIFLTSPNINYLVLSTLLEEENSQTDNMHAFYCKGRSAKEDRDKYYLQFPSQYRKKTRQLLLYVKKKSTQWLYKSMEDCNRKS